MTTTGRTVPEVRDPVSGANCGRIGCMHYPTRDPAWGRVTRPWQSRAPYVRAELADGSTVDGKATCWTKAQVYVHWQDEDWQIHNLWIDATHVRRIDRDESAWRDPYDDYAFYYPDAEG